MSESNQSPEHETTGGQVWLAVETATPVGSVALWCDGFALELTLRIQGTHSERLLPALDYALTTAGVKPEQVGCLVVGSGPGSFTGVRIAASMAKGWVMAQGAELYAYSSLLALAAGAGASGLVCALFDARRAEVYSACYEFGPVGFETLVRPGARRLDEMLDELLDRGMIPTFTGEGALVYAEAIRRRFPAARVMPEHIGVPRAGSLLWLRGVAPELGRVEAPGVWEPEYVRDWRVPEERKLG